MISKNPYTLIQVKRIRVRKSCRQKENFIKLATTNNDETFFLSRRQTLQKFCFLDKIHIHATSFEGSIYAANFMDSKNDVKSIWVRVENT